MYAPGRDQRIIKGDSMLEYETKGLLIEAFSKLRSSTCPMPEVEAEVVRLERVLRDEVTHQIRQYERRNSSEA